MSNGRGRDSHVVVVGGGITGLAAAHALLTQTNPPRVTVLESDTRLGGKIRTSPFAGLPAVDEGADAYLTRVPWARELAREIGLERRLTSPAAIGAAVWRHRLHRIPNGLVLGMPSGVGGLLRSRLLSPLGIARAGCEVLLPRTSTANDSLGRFVRARFGREVHERLVDPLIGSIYATTTENFSLQAVPQVAELAKQQRSVLRAAHRAQRSRPSAAGPIFEAPIGGMGELIAALGATVSEMGGEIRLGAAAGRIERDGGTWRVNDEIADAVILATSAHDTAELAAASPAAAAALGAFEYADVGIVALAVARSSWPAPLANLTGYLVPRPVQERVTAVSFGSSKWSHWRPPGRIVLRISLGRDGAPIDDLDDVAIVETAIAEVNRHLRVDLQPSAVRVSRWRRAFTQYRPRHFARVSELENTLAREAPGVFVAGASYRGMGIPACVQQGANAALAAIEHLSSR